MEVGLFDHGAIADDSDVDRWVRYVHTKLNTSRAVCGRKEHPPVDVHHTPVNRAADARADILDKHRARRCPITLPQLTTVHAVISVEEECPIDVDEKLKA